MDTTMPPGSTAARKAIDWRLTELEQQVAAAARGTGSPGAVFDGLMEAARSLREVRLTLDVMRALWDEARAAGYAARDAELRDQQAAQADEAGRPALKLVAAG